MKSENWFEDLGRAVANELELNSENSTIENQCGTVWVTNNDTGEIVAISGMITESDTEVA